MLVGGALGAIVIASAASIPAVRVRVAKVLRPRVTVEQQVGLYGPGARSRLGPVFASAGVAYPPARVAFLVFKAERRLDLYAGAREGAGGWAFVRSYPVLAASGRLGPKLREGDRQVPEGVYRIESLNPNSLYHLSLRVGYPSAFDRLRGREDGRSELGGNIMIHGGAASIGCLAMGDPAVEELFVLAADVGIERLEVVMCPADWRREGIAVETDGMPGWVPGLYELLRGRLNDFPARDAAGRP